MPDNETVQHVIARHFDHPSVYMGDPSPGSMRRAKRLMEALRAAGYEIVPAPRREEQPSGWGCSLCGTSALGTVACSVENCPLMRTARPGL